MKGKLILALTLVPIFAIANVNLHPEDLKQFETTGKCAGCDLSDVQFLQTNVLGPLDLQDADLSRASFLVGAQTQRQNSNFSDVFAPYIFYDNVDLSYSNFSNANISNGQFVATNFTGANFVGAHVSGANFASAIFSKAKISAKQLASAGSICNAILPDGQKGKC